MPSRPSSRTAARPGVAVPAGARIPQPGLVLWTLRALLLAALLLLFASPLLLTWARDTAAQAGDGPHQGWLTGPVPSATPTLDSTTDAVAPLLASVVLAILTPPCVAALGVLGLLGVGLMLGEVLLTVFSMHRQRATLPHIPITYLLVRATRPTSSTAGRIGGTATPSGDQFYRAIQRALPPGSWCDRLLGTAPWVALTLTGIPDQPIELGILVADRREERRSATATAIHAIIAGQLPGAQIDRVPDPLLRALTPGVTLAWREYGLHLAPHYPLRFLDDITGSDLLGPFVAALAPRGTCRTEAQIILRPATSWALSRSWRGAATALLLRLQAKADYALADDAKAVEAKLAAAPFVTTIRIAVVAEGDAAATRLEHALGQISEVLGQYHQRTSQCLQYLTPIGAGRQVITTHTPPSIVHTRAPRLTALPDLLLPLRPWRTPDMLTSIELAGLWHLPTPSLGSLIRWLPCTIIPPPPHAYIAPGRTDRIIVGTAKRADGTIGPVGPTLRDLRPPLHLTAGMGAGKSRALANICQQCIPHGFTLLDGKGDDQGGSLAMTVRSYLPLADEHRLILFDLLDTDWPIGLNPLAGIDLTTPGAQDQALGQIMAIFARLDPATWGKAPGMKEFVRMATLLVLEAERHPTLAHVKQCLLDGDYRTPLLAHCTNPDVLTFWTSTFPAQGEQQRTSLHALLRRFNELLTSETTRYVVSQPSSHLNLRDTIEDKDIVLVPLPHVTLDYLASASGMLLLQQFVRAAFSRPGTDQTRHSYPLIMDELQVFIGNDGDSTDIQHAITQLRGLGIAGIYAHQTLKQLGQMESEMLTNSGSRIILRTQEPDASTYAKLYAASGITANDIAGQDDREHQYAVLQCDGTRTGLFSMMVLPWPDPVPVAVPLDTGPDWQTLLPPDSPDPAADQELVQLVYQPQAHPANAVQLLAEANEEDWQFTLARWAAIRAYHHQYIRAHPGCIALDTTITDPDPVREATQRAAQQRLDRQRWLSRLRVATPRLLAAAEYARIRQQIAPGDDGAVERNGTKTRPGRREAAAPLIQHTEQGEVVVTPAAPAPAPEQLVPLGFVSGAVPPPGTVVAVPQIVDDQTFDAVMEARGRRRGKHDFAEGFDRLDSLADDQEDEVE